MTTPEGGRTSPTSFIQPVSKYIDVVDPQSSVSNDYADLPIVNKQLATNTFLTTQKNTIKPVGGSVTDFVVGKNGNSFFNTPSKETAPVYTGETNWAHKNTGSKYDSDPALRKISSQQIVDLVQEDRAGLYFPTSLEEARNILGDFDLTFSDTTTPFYNDKGEYMGILGESAFPYAVVVSEIAGEKPLLYFNTGGAKGGNKYIDYTGKTSWIDTPSAKTMSDQGTINDYILTSTSRNLDKSELTKDLSRKGINESWYDGVIGSAFDAENIGLGFSEALDESGNVDSNRMLEAFGTDDISKVIFGKPTLDLETERLIDIEANKPRDNVEYLTAAQKAELKDKWSNPGYQFYDENVQFVEYYNPSTGQYETRPLNLQNQNQIRGYLGEDAIPYGIAHDYDESGNLLKDTYLFSTGKDADRIAKSKGKNIYTNVPTKYGQTDSLGFTMTDRELDSFDISKSLGLDYDTTTPEQRKNELLRGYYDPQFLIVDSSGKTFVGDNLDVMRIESDKEKFETAKSDAYTSRIDSMLTGRSYVSDVERQKDVEKAKAIIAGANPYDIGFFTPATQSDTILNNPVELISTIFGFGLAAKGLGVVGKVGGTEDIWISTGGKVMSEGKILSSAPKLTLGGAVSGLDYGVMSGLDATKILGLGSAGAVAYMADNYIRDANKPVFGKDGLSDNKVDNEIPIQNNFYDFTQQPEISSTNEYPIINQEISTQGDIINLPSDIKSSQYNNIFEEIISSTDTNIYKNEIDTSIKKPINPYGTNLDTAIVMPIDYSISRNQNQQSFDSTKNRNRDIYPNYPGFEPYDLVSSEVYQLSRENIKNKNKYDITDEESRVLMSIFDEKEKTKQKMKKDTSNFNDELFDFNLILSDINVGNKIEERNLFYPEAIAIPKNKIGSDMFYNSPISVPSSKPTDIFMGLSKDKSLFDTDIKPQYTPNITPKFEDLSLPSSLSSEFTLFYPISNAISQSASKIQDSSLSLSSSISSAISSSISSAFAPDISASIFSDMPLSTESHDYPKQVQQQKQQMKSENQLRFEDSFTQRNEFENQFKRNIKNVKKDKRDDEEKKRRRKKISDENGVISYNRYLIYHPEIATPEQFSGFGEVSPIKGKSRYLNTEVLSWGGGSTVKKESKSDKNAKTIMKMMDALNFNVLPVAMSGRKSKVHSISKKVNTNKLNKKKLSAKI